MKYDEIVFKWYEKKTFTYYVAKDSTLEEALVKAKEWGYQEPKWYKPWTWNNDYSTMKTFYPVAKEQQKSS